MSVSVRSLLLCAGGLLMAGGLPPAHAQSVIATIGLDDGDPMGIPDNPFGITLLPEGTHALVAISGGFDDPNTGINESNRRVDVIEMDSLSVVGSLQTGFFPEDIVIATDGAGGTRRIYVTSSGDSSVTVFDGISNPLPVNTIPLPIFSFPFSAVLSPDESRLFVGTIGGAGDIFVIDADPNSATFETVIDTLNVPGGHGRMAFDGPSRLVVPHSVFAMDFSHADARVTVLDPDNPLDAWSVLLVGGGAFEYPGAQDCAVSRDGLAWIPVFGGPDDVFVVDVRARDLAAVVDLGPLAEDMQHGIALREDDDLAIVTNFVQSTVTFIDTRTRTVVGDLAVGNEPNEVTFSADGFLALVTNQNSSTVSVIGGLEPPMFRLSGPGFPALLDSVSFSFDGGEKGRGVRLLFSVRGNDTSPFESVLVSLTPPIRVRFNGTFDRFGRAATPPANVPDNPGIVGRSFHLQAVTSYSDGRQVASNAKTLVVQP